MKGGKKPWYVPVLAVLVLSGVMMSRSGVSEKLTLIPVAALFLFGFGMLIREAVKGWKKSDAQVLADYVELGWFFSGSREVKLEDRKKHFAGALGVWAVAFLDNLDGPGLSTALVFLGVILLTMGVPLLIAWKGDPAKTDRKVRPEAIAALMVGLLTCGFFCTFIGIGVYHGAWWFVLPLGLCFLGVFSRPLVAGLRTLLGAPRNARDRGEAHLQRAKEMDPWDRQDKKY